MENQVKFVAFNDSCRDSPNNNDNEHTSNTEDFLVSEDICNAFIGIYKEMIANASVDNGIPIPTVQPDVMDAIIEWCKYHITNPPEEQEDTKEEQDTNKKKYKLSEWDSTFFASKNRLFIYKLMMAANYMQIPQLVSHCAKAIVALIKGRTPDEIREIFEIPQLSPEEQEAIRNDPEWE